LVNKFDRHTLPRSAGWRWKRAGVGGVLFESVYNKTNQATFTVRLFIEEAQNGESFPLFSFPLCFCVACGRFKGFGYDFDVCWICSDELEDDVDEVEIIG
jgi:hypothetical protein